MSLPVDAKWASCCAATSSASGIAGSASAASVMLRALRGSNPSIFSCGGSQIQRHQGIELMRILDGCDRCLPEHAIRLTERTCRYTP